MLTQEDINLLLEAVETWKDIMPVEGHHMEVMMSGIVSGNPEQFKEAMGKAVEEAGRKRRSRKEQAILIQAKLIQMRDKMDVQEALQSASKGEKYPGFKRVDLEGKGDGQDA